VEEEDRAACPAEGLVLDRVRVVDEVAPRPMGGLPGPIREHHLVFGLPVEEQKSVRGLMRVPGRGRARLEMRESDDPLVEVLVERDVEEQRNHWPGLDSRQPSGPNTSSAGAPSRSPVSTRTRHVLGLDTTPVPPAGSAQYAPLR
jgi:hypothetical protein